MLKTDILIVGSGISGLFFAMKTAKKRPDLSLVIMTKATAKNSNTQLAQGGIAVVTNLAEDSFEQHINDTLKSGGGICDPEIVQLVIHQAPERLQELIDIGASFDKNSQGKWDLGLEGGHSNCRILHHKDRSGAEIEQKLLKIIQELPNVALLENHAVIDLTSEHKQNQTICTGAFYFAKESHQIKHIRSRSIILSTGGCGQLFENSTNPEIATGDAIAIAARAGVEIQDMQYIQFHPTALYTGKKSQLFLISEAIRGFGAHIVDNKQKRFLFKYDPRGELATRDIVSRAISTELKNSLEDHVYLDCRHLDPKFLYQKFPSITKHCNEMGLYPEKDLIPIIPAAHYQCGGVKVNQNGQSSIKNLYAIGECARTGLHGKNRLASNSLLEALVFAHQASENIDKTIAAYTFSTKILVSKFPNSTNQTHYGAFLILKLELQALLTFFYTSEDRDTDLALHQIKLLKNAAEALTTPNEITMPFIEFSNMLTTTLIIIKHCKRESAHAFKFKKN